MGEPRYVNQPPQTKMVCASCGPTSGQDGFVSVIDPPNRTVDYCASCWHNSRVCEACHGSGRIVSGLRQGVEQEKKI